MLEWLQHSSGEPWSEVDKAAMLVQAGRNQQTAALQWLRQMGAVWPDSFVGTDLGSHPGEVCWSAPAMQWALANGFTWAAAHWQCQQLESELHTHPSCKVRAQQVFAWTHNNGCPCTCSCSSESD
jgi:hypothetical protein